MHSVKYLLLEVTMISINNKVEVKQMPQQLLIITAFTMSSNSYYHKESITSVTNELNFFLLRNNKELSIISKFQLEAAIYEH